MSDYQILTVEQTAGGGLALRRKNADDTISPAATPVIGTASGFPLILGDAAEGRRFRSVRIPFGPVQAGAGDPSPSNIRALSPRTPVLYRCGANLYTGAGDTADMGYDGSGNIVAASGMRITGQIPVSGEGEIVLLVWGNALASGKYIRAAAYDANGTMLNGGAILFQYASRSGFYIRRITLPEGTAAVRVSLYGPWNLGIYAGSAEESFTMTAPAEAGDVYGGVWDPVTGTLTVDRVYRSLTGNESWAGGGSTIAGTDKYYLRTAIGALGSVVDDSGICSHFAAAEITGSTTVVGQKIFNSSAYGAVLMIRPEDAANATAATFKEWLAEQAAANTPVQVCWKLTEPAVYTVDAGTIAALSGVNTLFHDAWESGAGYDVAAEYVQDTGAAIEAANADTRAMIGEASGETASRSLAVGEYVTVGAALYRVTAAVGQGETLVPGTNVVETTVGAELVRLAGMINQ